MPIRPEMKVPDGDTYDELKRLSPSFGASFDVWLFPSRAESLDRTVRDDHFGPARARLEALNLSNMRIFDAAGILALDEDDYLDRSHPTPAATQRFARAIADAMASRSCAAAADCRPVPHNETTGVSGAAR